MNYIKAQQDLVSLMLTEKPRNVAYLHNMGERVTLLVHPYGYYAYVIPDALVMIDLSKCTELFKDPMKGLSTVDETKELRFTGEEIKTHTPATLQKWENADKVPTYVNKKLAEKFGKSVRFFQNEPRKGIITVAENINGILQPVGYLCPVNYKPNN